jgi:DnaJ-class molecular chaperone
LRGEAKRREYDRDISLEGIIYEILEVSRDASEQDINRAVARLAAQYPSVLDLGRGNGEKVKEVYKAYTVLRDRARRRGYERSDQHAPNQAYVEDELFFALGLEKILKELATEFGLSFEEKSIDPLGVLPLGRQVAHEFYRVGEQLLSDVLGIRVRGKVRGRRLF